MGQMSTEGSQVGSGPWTESLRPPGVHLKIKDITVLIFFLIFLSILFMYIINLKFLNFFLNV